ncbi:MAG: glycosyltransferase [Planctomycetes bacterium]|nr:glycosyltransferase [Planctomycetota bacterium]
MKSGDRKASDAGREQSLFDLSIVIPLGEGDGGIGALLTAVAGLARGVGGKVEVVLVDDGMPHGFETIATRWRTQFAGLVVARHENRKGRGAAARTGVLAARGEYLVMIDPQSEVPLNNADQLIEALQRGADVALVSRHPEEHSEAEQKSFLERATRTTVMRLSQMMVDVGVRDCFSGLTAFRMRAAKKIAQRSRVSGAAYPVEWLALAQYLCFQVVEFPLLWVRGPLMGERARRGTTPFSLLKDVWQTRRRLANDDYSTSLHQSELLSDTSFRKLDRETLQQIRRSGR